MKKLRILVIVALWAAAWGSAWGGPSENKIAKKYAEPLRKVFPFQERIARLHPVFEKVYPIAVVEDKTFYVFEPDPREKTYRLVRIAPDTFNIPKGIRAAMPLAFFDNRVACVVTGEIFGGTDGYIFIFHEFVHCAQWEDCEQKLKERLTVYREAMGKKDFMWELQYAFPYTDHSFVEKYSALFKAWDGDDAATVEILRAALKKDLTVEAWEYMTWQEWKEGLARYLENRIRLTAGLPENTGGEVPPFSRITFYRGGDKFIRYLQRRSPGAADDMEKLYGLIAKVGR